MKNPFAAGYVARARGFDPEFDRHDLTPFDLLTYWRGYRSARDDEREGFELAAVEPTPPCRFNDGAHAWTWLFDSGHDQICDECATHRHLCRNCGEAEPVVTIEATEYCAACVREGRDIERRYRALKAQHAAEAADAMIGVGPGSPRLDLEVMGPVYVAQGADR